MYAFLNKYGQALAFGIGVLITIIFLVNIFSADAVVFDTLQGDNRSYETDIFNFGMFASIALIVVAFAAAILFGLVNIAQNPKGSLKGLIGLAVLAAIVFIGYSSANGDVATESAEIQKAIEKFTTSQETTFTGGNLKFISGAILAALIMIALSIVTLVVFGIRGLFK